MSTRANIRFEDEYGAMHVDRSHDGFPDNILADIKELLTYAKVGGAVQNLDNLLVLL